MRWSRGAFEEWRGDWRRLLRLRPRQLLFYGPVMNFYPSMAVGWIAGAVSCVLYAGLGAKGFVVPPQLWLMLFTQSTILQLSLYFASRRHNVSPYEQEGSYGALGMVMSILAAPFYVTAMVASVMRRPARFVVTPKGPAASTDRLITFRYHLGWAGVFAAALGLLFLDHAVRPITVVWPLASISFCLVPIVIWAYETRWKPIARQDLERSSASVPG